MTYPRWAFENKDNALQAEPEDSERCYWQEAPPWPYRHFICLDCGQNFWGPNSLEFKCCECEGRVKIGDKIHPEHYVFACECGNEVRRREKQQCEKCGKRMKIILKPLKYVYVCACKSFWHRETKKPERCNICKTLITPVPEQVDSKGEPAEPQGTKSTGGLKKKKEKRKREVKVYKTENTKSNLVLEDIAKPPNFERIPEYTDVIK